jgi:ubiquinone/menaquinone biosynthesis C-methylase UbiE
MKKSSAFVSNTKLRVRAEEALRAGHFDTAELCVTDVLSRDSGDAAAIALLGDIAAARGDTRLAVGYYTLAIKADPAAADYKKKFISSVWNMPFAEYSDDVAAALLSCLKSPDLSGADMRAPWFTLLTAQPDFRRLYEAALKDGGPAYFSRLDDVAPLLSLYFLEGLSKIVINDPSFERFLTALRRFFLDRGAVYPALAAALAQYCFNTDYIFDVARDEQEKVDVLRQKIESGVCDDAAVYACYAPVATLENAAAVAEYLKKSAETADVGRLQGDEYAALAETAKKIIPVTEIDDHTSNKVREQYEIFPYPRWRTFPRAFADLVRQEGVIANKKGTRVLVAGCGTGQQPIQYAIAYPKTEFLAVDLSRASLSYAINKAREFGVANITFRQGDILKLGVLPGGFDVILCSGVLHHMQDPVAGWRVLNALLKPGGRMLISLYSKIARRPIARIRDIIAAKDYPATLSGIRAFRRDAENFLDKEALEQLWRSPDYFHASTCCDLLFHAREYQFDLPEIERVLKDLGLAFAGFKDAPPAPGLDPGNIDGWHAFEEKNPEIFSGMYHFWCRKPE